MAERLNAPVLKTGMGASPSRVRIPVPPPFIFMNIDIVEATLSDLNALSSLEEQVFDHLRYHTISKKQYRYLLTKGKCHIYKAVSDGELVGSVVVFHRKSSAFARLYSLAVDSAYRGQSIGRKLVEHVADMMRQKGCKGLLCEMRADDNRLLDFYQNLGFKITGKLPNYYADGAQGLKLKTLFNV